MKKNRKWKKAVLIIGLSAAVLIVVVLSINLFVKLSVRKNIFQSDELPDKEADCILVLGAYVKPDGSPSLMLRDRLDRAIELYQAGAAPKIVMSGDHGTAEYDEVNEMKQYAIDAGVASEDIFMDHAGFSTYESMYRIRDIFGADNIIVVTQHYHLYRALYDAKKLGLEANGVPAREVRYGKQWYRDLREIAARNKDFFYVLFKVKPTYLGDTISLTDSGDVTNDRP